MDNAYENIRIVLYQNWETSEIAQGRLIEMGEAAVPLILEALDMKRTHTSIRLINVLKEIYKRNLDAQWASCIIHSLASLLECSDHNTRQAISVALSEIGEPATPALVALLEKLDKLKIIEVDGFNFSPYHFALFTLGKIADIRTLGLMRKDSSSELDYIRYEAVVGMYYIIAKNQGTEALQDAFPELTKAINDEKAHIRDRAADALSAMFDIKTAPILFGALADKSEICRGSSIRGLCLLIDRCRTNMDVDNLEVLISHCYENRKKDADRIRKGLYEVAFARLKAAFADKRNLLCQDKGILLGDIPKPPKKGGMYKTLDSRPKTTIGSVLRRTVRNG